MSVPQLLPVGVGEPNQVRPLTPRGLVGSNRSMTLRLVAPESPQARGEPD